MSCHLPSPNSPIASLLILKAQHPANHSITQIPFLLPSSDSALLIYARQVPPLDLHLLFPLPIMLAISPSDCCLNVTLSMKPISAPYLKLQPIQFRIPNFCFPESSLTCIITWNNIWCYFDSCLSLPSRMKSQWKQLTFAILLTAISPVPRVFAWPINTC